MRVLVAGIGGASLGTEVLKCLELAGSYDSFGCDVSPYAFGHYQGGTLKTFVVPADGYVEAVLDLCQRHGIEAVIPGGEEPLQLLVSAAKRFEQAGIWLATNAPTVVTTCSDKRRLFTRLTELGLPVPWTAAVADVATMRNLRDIPLPCVVKPATGSGGSASVYLAATLAEARALVYGLLENGRTVLVQEYVPEDEGEFSIGTLSRTDTQLIGSIVMKRLFHAKLSVHLRTNTGLISSGYGQGLIDDFPDIRRQAERIAAALGNAGPLDIQGRVRDGILLPFEINPRFSGSVFLRAMAGFNQVDAFLQSFRTGSTPAFGPVRHGFYLRSLSEVFVPKAAVKAA
jgi:carbamoyl-phosphate synthase large subunit